MTTAFFRKRFTPRHTHRSALTLWEYWDCRARVSLDPGPTQPPASTELLRLGQGSGCKNSREYVGVARGQAPAALDWLSSRPAGGAPGCVSLSGSHSARRRGWREPGSQWTSAPEQLQRAGARPPRRRGRWGEARLAKARRRPGRATGGGGGTMEAAAVAPRPRLFPLVLAAAAVTLVPGATGERRGWQATEGRAGSCGARGPGPASGSLLLFLKHGAGPGAQVAAPGPGRAFLTGLSPRDPRAGREGGAGACVPARVDVPGSRRPTRLSTPRGGRHRSGPRSGAALWGGSGRGL